MSNLIRALAIATVVGLGLTAQASAHAELKSATPPVDGTTATAPTELDLKFSEDLNLKFSGVKVTGPDNRSVQTGEAALMDENTTLMAPISGTLAAGVYTVAWHALSADGHKTHGTYKFTVKP